MVKSKATFSVILLIVILTGVFIFWMVTEQKNSFKNMLKSQDTTIREIISAELEDLKNTYTIRINGFLLDKGIKKAVAEKNRPELIQLTKRRFNVLKKENPYFYGITFINKDYDVLLRVENVDNYGYNVKNVPFPADAIKSKEMRWGLGVTKIGVFFRVAAPIYHENKFVGICVFVVKVEKITDLLVKTLNSNYAMFILKSKAQLAEFQDYSPFQGGDFILISSNWEQLLNSTEKIDINSSDISRKIGDSRFAIHHIPLFDYKGYVFGKLMIGVDITEENKRLGFMIIRTIILSSFMIIASFLIMNVNFSVLFRKIDELNRSLENRIRERTKELELAKDELENMNRVLEKKVRDETEKRRKNEQVLFEQAKFSDIANTMSAIAHQWRQPLTSIGNYIQDAQDAYEMGELDKKYFAEFVDNSMKYIMYMSKTIDDFRNFFVVQGEKEQFSIVETISQVVSLLVIQYKSKNIRFVVRSGDSECNIESVDDIQEDICSIKDVYIIGFQNELKQVALNILGNAYDAMTDRIDKGGITTGIIRITFYDEEDFVSLSIQDNGGGIPAENLDHVFDPYYTTKEEGKGTGIGLYMSKVIIEEHMKGTIRVENSEEGAKFTITFNKSASI